MAADALAACVTKTSVAMEVTMNDTLVCYEEGRKLNICLDIFPQNDSASKWPSLYRALHYEIYPASSSYQ